MGKDIYIPYLMHTNIVNMSFVIAFFNVIVFLCFFDSLFLCFFVSLFLCFFVSLFLCFFVSLFLCFFVSSFRRFFVSLFRCFIVCILFYLRLGYSQSALGGVGCGHLYNFNCNFYSLKTKCTCT